MKFVAKVQESLERDANMMMRGFVKIQTAKVLCLRLQCLERIRADVLKFTTGTEGQVNRMSDDLISRRTIKSLIEMIRDCWAISPYVSANDMKLYSKVFNVVLNEISNCPTAFDKEKVVEKIKDESREERLEDVSISGNVYGYNIERVINEEDVIEIIEKGGIECDFM